jgi:hypothetical protein
MSLTLFIQLKIPIYEKKVLQVRDTKFNKMGDNILDFIIRLGDDYN